MLDMTSFDAALKGYYTDDAVEDMVLPGQSSFLRLMPKNEEFYGEYKVVPVILRVTRRDVSATFARAQTRGAISNSYLTKFSITRIKDYSIATIDNETLLASQSDRGAFMRAATLEIDGCIHSLTRSLAVDMYRGGWGDRAQVGSFSTTTITLKNTEDVVNFEVGMELDLADTQAGDTLHAYGSSGNGLIITGVDRDLGTLTFAYNVDDATNGIPDVAADDYIFVRGDRQNSATPTRLKLAGLEAWVPYTTPTSTAFFGVDRTADVTRLGGLRYDGSAVPIEEALIEGASRVGREGGRIDHYFMSFQKYAALEKALGSKVQYVDLKANARIAFRGIRVNGPRGEINVVPDQNCPDDRIFGLKLSCWELASIGKAVRVIDTDKLEMLRLNTQDGVEVRYGHYGNVCCNAPGHNIAINV